MMNAKAKEIGCTNTHFVTPNGLDSADAGGIHQTTARDLALIMSYAVKNKAFLHITQTRDYSFSDITGKRQFSVHNANAFLDMTPDAISGKPVLQEMQVIVMWQPVKMRKENLLFPFLAAAGRIIRHINGKMP